MHNPFLQPRLPPSNEPSILAMAMQKMNVKTGPNVIGNFEDFDNEDQLSHHQPFQKLPLIETSLNPMKTMTPQKQHSMLNRVKQRNANKLNQQYVLSGVSKLHALEKENGPDAMQWSQK